MDKIKRIIRDFLPLILIFGAIAGYVLYLKTSARKDSAEVFLKDRELDSMADKISSKEFVAQLVNAYQYARLRKFCCPTFIATPI